MDNNSVVRAVTSSDDGTLYIGGQGEFGSFSPDEYGRLRYTNLMLNLPESVEGDLKEVWDIHSIKDRIYFRFRRNIVLLDEYNHYTSIATDGISQSSCVMNNNVYFVTTNGLYAIGDGAPISVGGGDSTIPYDQVSAMTAYGDSIIIATNFDGLFIYNNGRCEPFVTSCDQLLKSNQLFSLAVNGSKLACGTVSGGVVIIDLDSGQSESVNINRGLGNNTILSIMFDLDGNLWCGLDNGIDMIELTSPLKQLVANQRYRFSGYCSLIVGDYIYLGTNQGLLRINNNDVADEPIMIKNSEGQVWNIQMIEGRVYCSHNRGLFLLEGSDSNSHLVSIYSSDGVWGATKIGAGKYAVGTYDGIELMSIDKSGTPYFKKLDNYEGSVREGYYHEVSRSLYFITGDGLERVVFDVELNIVSSELLYPSTVYDAKLQCIDGDVVIYTPHEIYLVGDDGALVVSDKYDMIFEKGLVYTMIEQDHNRGLWTIDNDRLLYRSYNEDKGAYDDHAQLIYNSSHFFINGFTHIKPLDDNRYIINNIFGYSLVDIARDNQRRTTLNPKIIGIYDTNLRDSLLLSSAYGVEPKRITLPYSQNSLRIIFGDDTINSGSVEFSYRLHGSDADWSDWSRISINEVAGAINQKEYTNLFEGLYRFDLRTRNSSGEIEITTVEIKILPPWQRSYGMYMLYIVLFCLGTLLSRQRISRYYADRRRLLELQKERKIENQKRLFQAKSMEQENNIIKLKNEKLESDIMAKSAELSNLMLNKLEKNDIITSVQSDLDKIRIEALNERHDNVIRRVKTLNRRLDDKLIDNVDWSIFEDNFNLINNNFVQKITERFNWMSINERKLCVYIKMGLQNKEIAPLLNLSVRGVEMLRYRIRKKMQLERSDSLYEYFQKL
ncbi:MAG: hypothetical protein R3Y39_02770 [Rikenellaceae bacterium]